jgi:dGTPase
MAYTRYIDKTQVFYLLKNSHITHRVLHVQMVSRIGRTIGQKLGLNLDLIEAMALGHDLGHPPFGHDGEIYLSELSKEVGLGNFVHAVMSVRWLERLEKGGRGLNLTLGVLDGILCHDGESDYSHLSPSGEPTFSELDRRLSFRQENPKAVLNPMTREGCVVRLADSISYVGRDLEDAIEIGLFSRDTLPREISEILGDTNGHIVYRLVDDLINQAQKKNDQVAFSPPVAQALKDLKDFNRQHIYFNPAVKTEAPKINKLYRILFETLCHDFADGPKLEASKRFLERLDPLYREEHKPEEKARDFIAGMTDDFFIHLIQEQLLPKWNLDSFV